MKANQNIYTVSKINSYIHELFSQEALFCDVCVKGEIGTLNYWNGGVIYFTLKDEASQLSAVMFSNYASKMTFKLEKGMEIMVRGTIDTNTKNGTYQLKAKEIVKSNDVGKAGEMLALLKQELLELGMFDEQYKKPIPAKIKTLGVVTSRTGAAITDIRKVTMLRNPGVQIILSPAIVQGDRAIDSVVDAIKRIEKTDVDVIIVGRGGGSDEDLWAFNNRAIAETVFNCPIPVISAVGHERDVTILDLVADARASTPSHAAELAVYDSMEALRRLEVAKDRLSTSMKSVLRYKKSEFERLKGSLLQRSPKRKIELNRIRLNDLSKQVSGLMDKNIIKKKHLLGLYIERLKGLSPLDKLSQGYTYTSVNGKTLNSVSMVDKDDDIDVFVKDGVINARVVSKKEVNFDDGK